VKIMARTVLGIFNDRELAEGAIADLEDLGYNPKDLSIVLKDKRDKEAIEENTGAAADVAEGAVSGATTGLILGGLAGLVAATVLPGIGALFIGGPIAAALGLSGAAATTVSGAATGAVAGGLIGALTNLGLSDDEAKVYEDRVSEGGILVAVPVRGDESGEVEDVFEENKATDVKSVTSRE
jgi:uncharacterized membrane protein